MWDPSADAVTAGYRVYYGTSPGTYPWSVDAGNRTSVPINLSTGVYRFVVRGYNAANDEGPASSEVTVSVGTAVSPPTAAIQASLQSSTSALVSWQTSNAVSASINGVSVPVAGSRAVDVSTTTTFTITATSSTGATATASATVTLGSGGTAPLSPVNMHASVSGSRVTLSWQPNTSGGAAAEYLLYVGTSSWATNVANGLSIGHALSATADLRRGTYYARVRARNASGTSRSSSQVSFRIGRRLSSPTGFRAAWQGSQATLTWAPSADQAADVVPTGFVLEAGSAPGLADVATISLGGVTSFSADVPAGIYFVRVRAVNDEGDSDPTNEIVLAAPGTAQAPRALTSSGSGSTVRLSWTPPAGGEAPVGYVIEAGSEPGLSDLASLQLGNVTEFSTDAPPGTYYVRVRAVNARGRGVPSNEIVVQR